MKLNLAISSRDKKYSTTPKLRALLRRAIMLTLESEGLEGEYDVSLAVVDADEIREINKSFRNVDSATDVLSFPLSEDVFGEDNSLPISLGDIIVCGEVIDGQAGDFGNDYVSEFIYMTIHSTLHLLGYDHVDSPEEEKTMFEKQDAVFEKFKKESENFNG